MFEIEIKAIIDCNLLSTIKEQIHLLKPLKCEKAIYHDIYYDNNAQDYFISEKELRLRKISHSDNTFTNIFTLKESPFDSDTKSKKEHEVSLSDFDKMNDIILNLGFEKDIEFTKECEIYYVNFNDISISVTIAYLPELEEYYIELEHQTVNIDENIDKLKHTLSDLLSYFLISESCITTKYYTDSIREKRRPV